MQLRKMSVLFSDTKCWHQCCHDLPGAVPVTVGHAHHHQQEHQEEEGAARQAVDEGGGGGD